MPFELSVEEMEFPGSFVFSSKCIQKMGRCTQLSRVSNLSFEELDMVFDRVKEIVFSYQSKHPENTITCIPADSIYVSFVSNNKMEVYVCEDYIETSDLNISWSSHEIDELKEVLENLRFNLILAVSAQNDDCSSSKDIFPSSCSATPTAQRSF